MTRLNVLVGIIGFIAFAVLTRLFFLQISRADEYRASAERQHVISLLQLPRRGSIFFEDKTRALIPAAITRQNYLLEGNPQQIEDPQRAYNMFSSVLSLGKELFLSEATATDTSYAIFARDVPRDMALRMMDMEIPGFWLSGEEKRVYPEDEIGSHTLGFVGYTNNERMGQYGIEQQYNDVLSGKRGSYSGAQSQEGFLLSFTDALFSQKKDGLDIVLTIDPHIQSMAHAVTLELLEQWHAESVGILVLQPKTGAVLAMESMPSFDPNRYGEITNYDLFLNPFTQKVFEMGSIVKPLTMAAGLDARAITENTTYYDAGFIRMGDAIIRNYDGKGRGTQRMYDILDQSLNTGAVFIMQQLGERTFYDYMDRFGLSTITGIDLPYEVPGNLKNLEKGGLIEYATASFGQGIAVTPLALATALSAVGNGGNLMQPYIVQRIMDGETVVQETEPVLRRQVLRQETSETVSRILSQVVDKTLAGGIVSMPGYHIAAKTGTAQIPNKNTSGYSDFFLHTFFGYAPAFDPQFLILLYMEKPQGVRYSSQTLATPFQKLTRFIINYYEIPPDR